MEKSRVERLVRVVEKGGGKWVVMGRVEKGGGKWTEYEKLFSENPAPPGPVSTLKIRRIFLR